MNERVGKEVIKAVACLQVELLVPNRVEFLGERPRSLLNLAHLYRHVWIGGTALVFGYQPLGALHYKFIEIMKTVFAVYPIGARTELVYLLRH